MKFKQLIVGSEIVFYDKKCTILAIAPPNVLLKRSSDNETFEVAIKSLIENSILKTNTDYVIENSINEIKGKTIAMMIPEDKRALVTKRYETIKPILEYEKAMSSKLIYLPEFEKKYQEFALACKSNGGLTQGRLIECISRKSGKSIRTIRRYLYSYHEAEKEHSNWGEEGLIPKSNCVRKDNKEIQIFHPNKNDVVLGSINTRLSAEHIEVIEKAIKEEYLDTKNKRRSAIFADIDILCSRKKLEPISSNSLYKIFGKIDEKISLGFRGPVKAKQIYNDVDRVTPKEEAKYSLHIVAIDHQKLDIDVIDEKTGYVIGRPWVTIGMDLFSRMIWCVHISFDEPSSHKVMKALLNGIFVKHEMEMYGTQNDWITFGIPTIIQFDNGTDFKSKQTKRMVTEVLGTDIRFRPVRTPNYGGKIERFFGTLNTELIHRLDGTRKSNVKDLGEYDPEKEAKLTLEDIKKLISIFIVDIYHFSEHKGLPLEASTPAARYNDGLQLVGLPRYIDPIDEELFTLELLPQEFKPYTRDGIRMGNVQYKSQELNDLIEKATVKYTVKHDPNDISKIYVLHPKKQRYFEVWAVDPPAEELVGVSRYLYKKLRQIRKREGIEKNNLFLGVRKLRESKEHLAASQTKMYKKSRSVRRASAKNGAEVIISYSSSVKSKIDENQRKMIHDLIKEIKGEE